MESPSSGDPLGAVLPPRGHWGVTGHLWSSRLGGSWHCLGGVRGAAPHPIVPRTAPAPVSDRRGVTWTRSCAAPCSAQSLAHGGRSPSMCKLMAASTQLCLRPGAGSGTRCPPLWTVVESQPPRPSHGDGARWQPGLTSRRVPRGAAHQYFPSGMAIFKLGLAQHARRCSH